MSKPSRIIQGISRIASSLVGRREESAPEPQQAAPAPAPERRRDSRSDISMPGQRSDYVRVCIPPAKTSMLVSNLSMRGLCLYISDDSALPGVGEELDAVVHLGAVEVPARLFIAHRGEGLAGCHIVEPTPTWLKEVARVLDPIRMGKRLREIDPNFVRQDRSELTVRWFQSGPACDLYVWTDPAGAVAKAQLFFDWQIVEWTPRQGLRVGRAASPPGREAGHPSADLFEFSDRADPEVLGAAQRLMNAARMVPEEIRRLFT